MVNILKKIKEEMLLNFKGYPVNDVYFGEGYRYLCCNMFGETEIGKKSIFIKKDNGFYLNIQNKKLYQLVGSNKYEGGRVVFLDKPIANENLSLTSDIVKPRNVKKIIQNYLSKYN